MVTLPVFLDNHSTTRVDPRVIEVMLPYFGEVYGNVGSTSHVFGWEAAKGVDKARAAIASAIGARDKEILFTSGATESNNLAIKGLAASKRRRGNHLVSVVTEHKAVLDPLKRLSREGWEITLVEVEPQESKQAGRINLTHLEEAIRDDTALVSVMLANNEIGVIQPLAEIGALCRDRGVPLHTDATQAVGRMEVDVASLGVDLMSFSAHKMYGPKGIGALYVNRRNPKVRLLPLIEGGGQETGLRSGTLNVPSIVGFARALDICLEELPAETVRLRGMRDRLAQQLLSSVAHSAINGPALDSPDLRLAGNLNMRFGGADGEALMMSMPDLALSSGSACTSVQPEPSHVLKKLGLSDDEVRSSLRFGLGRFTTEEEIDFAVQQVAEGVERLRQLG